MNTKGDEAEGIIRTLFEIEIEMEAEVDSRVEQEELPISHQRKRFHSKKEKTKHIKRAPPRNHQK